MLDCKGVMTSKAALVGEQLLINASENPNGRDEWGNKSNQSQKTVFSGAFVVL